MSQLHTHSAAICTPIASRVSIMQRISNALTVARTRRALAKLDADALADIGVTREEALLEANRPLWDAPSHWSR